MSKFAVFRRKTDGENATMHPAGEPTKNQKAGGWFSGKVAEIKHDLSMAHKRMSLFSIRPEGVTEEMAVDLRQLDTSKVKPVPDRTDVEPLKVKFVKPVDQDIDLAEFCGSIKEDGERGLRSVEP